MEDFVSCDPLGIHRIPSRILEYLSKRCGPLDFAEWTMRRDLCPQGISKSTEETIWTFPRGLIATGCSEYPGWFFWVDRDLIRLRSLEKSDVCG